MPTLGHGSMTFIDQSNKSSVQRVSLPLITAGNIAALTTAFANLVTATQNMSAGTLTRSLIGNLTTATSPAIPAAPASRSDKFAVSYHDGTTGDKYTTQIPVAKITGVTYLAGTRLLDMSVDPTLAWITAFTTVVVSEDGNGVTVDQIRWVGRHI